MGNEEGKMSSGILFVVAFVLFVAAIVVYLGKEDTAYTQVAEGVKNQEAVVGKIEKAYQELQKQLEAVRENQAYELDFREKMVQKIQMLEMRLDSQPKPVTVSHKDSPMPQPLKVELTTPIPIKMIYREAKPVKKEKAK